jgi:hypothetical protein
MKHRNATVALAICLICSLGASWASAEPPEIGDPRVFRSTNVPVVAVAALDSGRFIVANPDMSNEDGQVTVGTVSATNISIGLDTYTTFADSIFNPHVAVLSSSNFVIAYGISFGSGGGGAQPIRTMPGAGSCRAQTRRDSSRSTVTARWARLRTWTILRIRMSCSTMTAWAG